MPASEDEPTYTPTSPGPLPATATTVRTTAPEATPVSQATSDSDFRQHLSTAIAKLEAAGLLSNKHFMDIAKSLNDPIAQQTRLVTSQTATNAALRSLRTAHDNDSNLLQSVPTMLDNKLAAAATQRQTELIEFSNKIADMLPQSSGQPAKASFDNTSISPAQPTPNFANALPGKQTLPAPFTDVPTAMDTDSIMPELTESIARARAMLKMNKGVLQALENYGALAVA